MPSTPGHNRTSLAVAHYQLQAIQQPRLLLNTKARNFHATYAPNTKQTLRKRTMRVRVHACVNMYDKTTPPRHLPPPQKGRTAHGPCPEESVSWVAVVFSSHIQTHRQPNGPLLQPNRSRHRKWLLIVLLLYVCPTPSPFPPGEEVVSR